MRRQVKGRGVGTWAEKKNACGTERWLSREVGVWKNVGGRTEGHASDHDISR